MITRCQIAVVIMALILTTPLLANIPKKRPSKLSSTAPTCTWTDYDACDDEEPGCGENQYVRDVNNTTQRCQTVNGDYDTAKLLLYCCNLP